MSAASQRPPSAGTTSSSFEEVVRGTATLATHAVETGAPLFLLVHYRHDAEKREWVEALAQRLGEADIEVRRFDLWREPELGTGRLYSELGRLGKREVGVVISLPRGERPWEVDPEFLAYVNLHRDEIARSKLRWVLAVHESEEEALLAQGGDLWDFRQQDFWLERPPEAIELPEPSLFTLTAKEEERLAGESEILDGAASMGGRTKSIREQLAETPDPELRARLLMYLTEIQLRGGWYESASQTGLEALEELPEGIGSVLEARIEAYTGEALTRAGKPDEALTHLRRAEEIGFTTGLSSVEQRMVLLSRAEAHAALGELEIAVELFKDAAERDVSGNQQHIWNRLAAVLWKLGRLEEAQLVLKNHLTTYGNRLSSRWKAEGDLSPLIEAGLNLAGIYFLRRQWDRAAACYRPWLEQDHDLVILKSFAQLMLAWVRVAQQDYVGALRGFAAVLDSYKSEEIFGGRSVVWTAIAKLYTAWGWEEQAAALPAAAEEAEAP